MQATPLILTSALGLGLGLKHALESDHVAAITTMVTAGHGPRQAALVGAAWGGGHAVAVLVAGAILVALGITVPPAIAVGLDLAVVAMLVALGIGTMRSHATGHGHDHVHAPSSKRAALVGLVHGASGTAALTLLVLTTIPSRTDALAFLLLFAAGATASMTALSAALAVPIGAAARKWSASTKLLRVASGLLSIGTAVVLLADVVRSA